MQIYLTHHHYTPCIFLMSLMLDIPIGMMGIALTRDVMEYLMILFIMDLSVEETHQIHWWMSRLVIVLFKNNVKSCWYMEGGINKCKWEKVEYIKRVKIIRTYRSSLTSIKEPHHQWFHHNFFISSSILMLQWFHQCF